MKRAIGLAAAAIVCSVAAAAAQTCRRSGHRGRRCRDRRRGGQSVAQRVRRDGEAVAADQAPGGWDRLGVGQRRFGAAVELGIDRQDHQVVGAVVAVRTGRDVSRVGGPGRGREVGLTIGGPADRGCSSGVTGAHDDRSRCSSGHTGRRGDTKMVVRVVGSLPDLATRFATSGGEVIEVDGRDVQPLTTLAVQPGDVLEVTRLTANRLRPQALRLALHDGTMIVSSTTSAEVALWTNTAPRKARVRIDTPDATYLDLWNSWRFGGLEHAWLGNAGMVVQSDRGRYTLQCSDGIGPPDFTDLVVTVQILPR